MEGWWQPRSCTSSGTWNLDDIRDECEHRTITPEVADLTDDQARQLAELYTAVCSPQPGFTDPQGAAFAVIALKG